MPRPPIFLSTAVALLCACTEHETPPVEAPAPTLPAAAPPIDPTSQITSGHTLARARSGGDTTVADTTADAFSNAAANLLPEHLDTFSFGNSLFNRAWVIAPASTVGNDGLGPLFNARSCSSCHPKDGRGRPPESPTEPFVSILLRLSVPGVDTHGGPAADPVYGTQLQPLAILGVAAEGTPRITYQEQAGAFADGVAYSLRAPSSFIENPGYGPFSPSLLVSPRVGSVVFGLGLLAAVADGTLDALADPDDRDGDGISGRLNHVWNSLTQTTSVGRFGWKANVATLAQQTAGAFQGDLGISSSLLPAQECSPAQPACLNAPTGADTPGAPEITDDKFRAVLDYMTTLAVPARRDVDNATVQRGEELFGRVGCATCHRETLPTAILDRFPEVSNQTIHPYTDLLLHDLGPELADNRPDFEATGSEWRTPPLWGIGLVHTVNGHTYFLHDGRARSLLEAILWHGGEAAAARERVRQLSADDRAALVRFLESL